MFLYAKCVKVIVSLTLLHSERPKLYTILAILSVVVLTNNFIGSDHMGLKFYLFETVGTRCEVVIGYTPE